MRTNRKKVVAMCAVNTPLFAIIQADKNNKEIWMERVFAIVTYYDEDGYGPFFEGVIGMSEEGFELCDSDKASNCDFLGYATSVAQAERKIGKKIMAIGGEDLGNENIKPN